jgi:hypothetical protein
MGICVFGAPPVIELTRVVALSNELLQLPTRDFTAPPTNRMNAAGWDVPAVSTVVVGMINRAEPQRARRPAE